MDQMVECPDCGTPNSADADLCVQCWRGMSAELARKIPVGAFAAAPAAAPLAPPRSFSSPPPPAAAAPAREDAPPPAREPVPPPVPYFVSAKAPVAIGIPSE
ncbi:MAG: hypothetical protein M3273_04205, partial [Actinomycetota bacterium]|nr:hypothetical protein [Actinomycetota bacterium]